MTDPTSEPEPEPEPEPDDLPIPGFGFDDPPAPIDAYRQAFQGAEPGRLRAILRELGAAPGRRSTGLVDEIIARLGEPGQADRWIDHLIPSSLAAVSLFARSESQAIPLDTVLSALLGLGHDPALALARPMSLGILAPRPGTATDAMPDLDDPASWLRVGHGRILVAHPVALQWDAARLEPEGIDGPPLFDGDVRLVRESDGLEPVLRLSALWQRMMAMPSKRTRQGDLYKRDRQRLDDDPALAGPIGDVLQPPDDPVSRWLNLARAVGLLQDEPGSDRIVAAPSSFWTEHGVHLPQMIASRWLVGADRPEADEVESAAIGLRAAALAWLSERGEDHWVSLEALAQNLADRVGPTVPRLLPTKPDATEPEPAPPGRKGRSRDRRTPDRPFEPIAEQVRADLRGMAYLMGLIRAGEAAPGGDPVVQITPRGRYVLGLGPPPPPPPRIEQFLFVQPNFEIVAYRQGMNPVLIGRLSRFARWAQIGAALTLRLTPESIYHGLESGLSADDMHQWLSRHAVRPIPDGVSEAITTWAGRRERLTYYPASTLIEFADADALDAALSSWPEDATPPPIRLTDRLLLVEDESSVPFQRFRLLGARDYRRPPEVCVAVEPDGVTLSVDPARGDLFVEAELARFADPIEATQPSPRRRVRVTPATLRRALSQGMTPSSLARWFEHRTGGPIPPALHLLLHTIDHDDAGPPSPPLLASRPLILRVPTPGLLDGLLQHPDTRDLLSDRLGPTTAIIRSPDPSPLRDALRTLGLDLQVD